MLCWIMLIACFIIKLIGGNWFEIICDNKTFVSACSFIDNHIVIKYGIAFVFYISTSYFVLKACCFIEKPNLKQVLLILIVSIIVWLTQFISMLVKSIIEIIMFVVLPFFVVSIKNGFSEWKTTLKNTWYHGIVAYILLLIFQLLSLITKNVGIKITDTSTLTSMLLMIDYYLMIVLYCLYVKIKIRKEK